MIWYLAKLRQKEVLGETMRFVFLWDTWAAVASILLVFGKGVFFKVDTGATDKVIVYKSCGELLLLLQCTTCTVVI